MREQTPGLSFCPARFQSFHRPSRQQAPAWARRTHGRAALEANDLMELTGGATLSVIAGTGHFRLQRIESAEALELSGRPLLEGFLDATMKWHQMVVNARAPEQSPESIPMMGDNFISV